MAHFAEQDLTQGKISHQLAIFAWPMVLTNLLQTLFALTDILLVGRFLGRDAMSAVTVGGQSTLFLLTFSLGLTAGGQILIAQLKGAEKSKEQAEVARTLFILALIVGIAVALLGFSLAPTALRLLQTPEEALEGARQYMRMTTLGLPFAFAYNAVAGVLRGLGDAKRPLLFAAVAAVLHLCLGLFFVGRLDIGMLGAALATVIAQATAGLLGCFYLYTRKEKLKLNLKRKRHSSTPRKLGQILKIGIPFGLQMCLLNFSNLFIIRLVNPYGAAASAALGAGSRVTNVLIMPMLAIGNAASTMVGQNLGAGKPERASATVRWALVYTLAFVALTFTLTLLFPAAFISLFTDDSEVLQIGVQYLSIMTWCYAGYALHSSCNAAILGAGFALYSLFAVAVEALVGRMGLTWVFSGFWGLSGIFTAQTIAPYLAAALSMAWYLGGRWRKSALVDKNTP